jgi:hypothetical protein
MNKKTNILKRASSFLCMGLLVFGTGCTEFSEMRRENHLLTEKFTQLQ